MMLDMEGQSTHLQVLCNLLQEKKAARTCMQTESPGECKRTQVWAEMYNPLTFTKQEASTIQLTTC